MTHWTLKILHRLLYDEKVGWRWHSTPARGRDHAGDRDLASRLLFEHGLNTEFRSDLDPEAVEVLAGTGGLAQEPLPLAYGMIAPALANYVQQCGRMARPRSGSRTS